MKLALAGLPGSGKSTLFSALSGLPGVLQGQPPSGKRVPASVKVPDARLERLRDIFQPRKFTPATVEFGDLPGLPTAEVKGKGELLGALRESDALLVCLKGFGDAPDPAADLRTLEDECHLADLGILEKRVERLRRDVTKPSKTQDADRKELALVERLLAHLSEKGSLANINLRTEEAAAVRPYGFLTMKARLVVVSLEEGGKTPAGLQVIPSGTGAIPVHAKLEAEIAQLPAEERAAFLKDYGIAEPAAQRLIRAAYDLLGLISFFTMGEDEVRAWTVRRGDTAVVAAGKIHTDIAKGFVRAETVGFEAFVEAGTLAACRAKGTLRLEGRDYAMKDGDCVNFRFTPPGAKA